jgi:NTE family protein
MGMRIGRRKFGLVFGGGGARGGAHIGAWRVLNGLGYKPDIVVGASIGGLIAAMVGMGMTQQEMETHFTLGSPLLLDTACNDGRGRTRTERLSTLIRETLGNVRLEDMNPRVAVTATCLRSQQRVLIQRGPAWKAVQASMSIPGVFDPMEWDDKLLVDGGVLDNVPTQAAYQLGAEALVAVDIGGDNWTMESALNTVGCVNRQLQKAIDWVLRITKREVTLDTWIRSTMMPAANLSRLYMASCPPDVLINPDMQDIWLLAMDRVQETYEVGEQAARDKLADVERLMKSRRIPTKEVPKFLPAFVTV